MKDVESRPLFIFEMANNHSGSVEHGVRIVNALREATRGFPFTFAVKLQYRDIDTFIHADYKDRDDLKFVKRFSETRLSWDEFRRIKDAIDVAFQLGSDHVAWASHGRRNRTIQVNASCRWRSGEAQW